MALVAKAVYEKCILLGIDVFNGLVSSKAAVAEAVAFGSNQTSAADTIRVIICMAKGQRYLRGLSGPATDFALQAIHEKLGSIPFGNALSALESHIKYGESRYSNEMHTLRGVLARHTALRTEIPSIETLDARQAEDLDRARARTSEERAARLAAADPIPKRTMVTATVFQRNMDVVAKVLFQAEGICAGCMNPAPFARLSNGLPYLEVHHRIPLAEGGDDTVANAIALCPNCHREAHSGQMKARFQTLMPE